jgi:hypothetical protein
MATRRRMRPSAPSVRHVCSRRETARGCGSWQVAMCLGQRRLRPVGLRHARRPAVAEEIRHKSGTRALPADRAPAFPRIDGAPAEARDSRRDIKARAAHVGRGIAFLPRSDNQLDGWSHFRFGRRSRLLAARALPVEQARRAWHGTARSTRQSGTLSRRLGGAIARPQTRQHSQTRGGGLLVRATGSQRVCWRTYDRGAELAVWSCRVRRSVAARAASFLAPGRMTASRLERQRRWGGEAAALVLASQEFVANGGGRSSRRRCRNCIAGADGQPWPCRSTWLLAFSHQQSR